jgi:hypothetical protein
MLRATIETIRVLHKIEDPGIHFLELSNVYHRMQDDQIILSGKPRQWFNHFETVTESVFNYAQLMYLKETEPVGVVNNEQLIDRDWRELNEFHQFLMRCSW